MTKEIEEIVDDAKRLSLRPVSLGNSSGLSGQQRKAVWEAESGLCFWRRTDLEAVEKMFVGACPERRRRERNTKYE